MFEPWQLGMLDETGYNGIRDEHIEKISESLRSKRLTDISRTAFETHCYKCGIDPNNFTQEDLDELQKQLNK